MPLAHAALLAGEVHFAYILDMARGVGLGKTDGGYTSVGR